MQNEDQHKLIQEIKNYIPNSVIATKNKSKSWEYGYNEKYDVIVISKTGQINDIIEISGLIIALPKPPQKIHSRSKSKKEQYWQPDELLKDKAFRIFLYG